jgi:hypothetical protein
VYSVSDDGQIEIGVHTADSLTPDPRPFEDEIAIAKLKKYKAPHSDLIPAEMIQAGDTV